jgi:hypothetical protein
MRFIMKKLILLYFVFSVSAWSIYSQPASQIINDNVPFINNNTGDIGAQCINGLVYDDNTWENGYGWNPGYGIGKYVMKFTPLHYPYTIGQVCLALTKYGSGTSNWTFDIEIYDTTGTGGGPGNLVASLVNQTAVNVPSWGQVSWFDFTGITTIPTLLSGSYYVGISWDPVTMGGHYVAADESPATPGKSGYAYIQNTWSTLLSFFPSYRAIGVRVDSTGITYTHDIKAGPYINLPDLYVAGSEVIIKAIVSNIGTSNETGVPFKFLVNGVLLNTVIKNLNAGAIDTVSFNWTPSLSGNNNLRVIASLFNDGYRNNDTVKTNVNVNPEGAVQHCIGTGTTPVGYPFYTFYMDAKTDMLYLSSEIGNDGRPAIISYLGFNVMSAVSVYMNGFKIKMQNTTNTSISGFLSSGWETVYNHTYAVYNTGWRWFTLDTPFVYNGTNLLVEVCFNNSAYSISSTVASTAVTGKVYHNHYDLPAGDGCMDITSGLPQATRPNICLYLSSYTGLNNNNNISSSFSLSQNYPNPFNPMTTISYSIPPSRGARGVTDVKLTIFDVVGKVIEVLVNEKQNAGSYSIEWDGTNYSSGLYFYRLETEYFTDVKKMVLIK